MINYDLVPLIGSASSTYLLTHGATKTQSLDLRPYGARQTVSVAAGYTVGTNLTTAPTVAFGFSLDGGLRYFYESFPITSSSSSLGSQDAPSYTPPAGATHVIVSITNNDASVAMNCVAEVMIVHAD